MKRMGLLAGLSACAMLCAAVASAAAAGALAVYIVAEAPLFEPLPEYAFAASGQAVDEGLLPGEGTVSDVSVTRAPAWGRSKQAALTVVKRFACGNGTFDFQLSVRIAWVEWNWGTTDGRWSVIAGTGAYEGLRGNGTIAGLGYIAGDAVIVAGVYSGKLTLPPPAVHIEVPTPLPAGLEVPFTASGPAVALGYICAEGVVATGPVTWIPVDEGYATLTMFKYFACDCGTFDVWLAVTADLSDGGTIGTWSVVNGTGKYVGLKGEGTLVGTWDGDENIVYDVYDGVLHY